MGGALVGPVGSGRGSRDGGRYVGKRVTGGGWVEGGVVDDKVDWTTEGGTVVGVALSLPPFRRGS